MLLEKLKPSIRLLVKKYIVFSESVIVVGKRVKKTNTAAST